MLAQQHKGATVLRLAAIVTLLALALSIAGCGAIDSLTDSGREASTSSPSMGAPGIYTDAAKDEIAQDLAVNESDMTAPYAAGDAAIISTTDRLIIRNKSLRIEVQKVAVAVDQIKAAAKTHDAVITNMQVASDNGSPIYRYEDTGSPSDGAPLLGYITVRVPADSFSAFVDEVSTIGTVRYQAETSDDVTQQHVDMKARLENLRAEEKRLREFFDAAKDVKDMLSIEQELSRVRGEIESMDAQVKYLERQAAMATVTIDLSEPQSVVRPSGQDWGFGDAVTTGFRGAAGAIQLLIIVTITLAPYLVLMAILFFVGRTIVRSRRAKRAATESDEFPTPLDEE
ncbi:MAG: hypothetical protein CVT66_07505 [Actinobacteria bacterium HGW-Actinobacteria-6]|nr:MAG: hypothetical protein CVT66_07505 [Actinobacteria bacterium HGW-Actinobacteria-6]